MTEIIKTLEQFVRKAQTIHGERYDYSQFVYTDARTKGIIVCSIHGPFEKSPDKHIHRQQGCAGCSNQKKREQRTLTVEHFVAKALEVHGERYDYTQFLYVSSTTKGKIRCIEHDIVFDQSPSHHLSGHSSCEKCIQNKSRETQLERYGAEHHSQTAEFAEKVRATSQERFGVDHYSKTAEHAERTRQANLAQFGVEYASQSAEFQARVRETSQDNHGVNHHLRAPGIRTKIKQTNLERYGRENIKQAHMSDATIDTINDKKAIEKLLETYSVREIAKGLGISDCTLGRYCASHGILLPASSYEPGIADFLRQHTSEIDFHNRTVIAPLEIDFLLPDHKVGIEFSGIYYHGEAKQPDKIYHLNKLSRMLDQGYRLITIFEDEWLHKRGIVENRLRHLLGKSEKGKGARQLTVAQIDARQATEFLDAHHIQGYGPGGFARYGAFDGDRMVACMTFSRPRVALGRTEGADEMLRFATDGSNYPGVASRLFQAFLRDFQPAKVISYADRRWSEGQLYRQLGFSLVHATEPNYWYTDRNKIIREHRFKYRKDQIQHLVENGANKTEQQIMLELGRDRIWDCGSLKFEWTAN